MSLIPGQIKEIGSAGLAIWRSGSTLSRWRLPARAGNPPPSAIGCILRRLRRFQIALPGPVGAIPGSPTAV